MKYKSWKEYFLKLPAAIQECLLTDRAVRSRKEGRRHMIWASDAYETFGEGYRASDEITVSSLLQLNAPLVQPLLERAEREQQNQVRKKAAVFTPSWMCCLQNDLADGEWFGRANVFHTEKVDQNGWKTEASPIRFPELPGKTWKKYADRKVLEITCGEAPYLVSRYDAVTGDDIPVGERIGMLDRKLRIVGEQAETEEEWMRWARRAYEATYGYEYQGDSLFLARMNLLKTYEEYKEKRWGKGAAKEELAVIARILSWNLWQMDGLSGFLPLGEMGRQYYSDSLFGEDMRLSAPEEIESRIHNWRSKETCSFQSLTKQDKGGKAMKFDVIIGNPPYQIEGGSGGNNDSPIYQYLVKSSMELSNRYISYIIPARWFTTGRENLLGEFRRDMLANGHIKTMVAYTESRKVFPHVELKGGVCYFLIDKMYEGKCDYTLIEDNYMKKVLRVLNEFNVLIRNPMLSEIVKKVWDKSHGKDMVDSIISSDTPFGIPSNPKTSKKKPMNVFTTYDPLHNVQLFHIEKQSRKIEFISRQQIKKNINYIDKDKVFIPGAGGSGNDPYVLGKPELASKGSVCSQSYLFAAFNSKKESEVFIKYLKTKFFRILVSAMKISQSAPKRSYCFVPLQDFTPNSDIDWTKSVHDIDQQLYKKYGLTDEEISFIESKVKEMK